MNNQIKELNEFGMSVFNAFAKEQEVLEVNRPSVSKFVGRLATQHITMIEKYGRSVALDTIFQEEIISFYVNALKAPEELVAELLNKNLSLLKAGEKMVPENCVINYPCFSYRDEVNGALAHTPVVRGYVLNGYEASLIDIDYELIEERYGSEGQGFNVDVVVSIMRGIAKEVVSEWSEGHTLKEETVDDLEEGIFIAMMQKQEAACKEQIVREVATEAEDSSVLELLGA